MKIYNKTGFVFGILLMINGCFLLYRILFDRFGLSSFIFMLFGLLGGMNLVRRSFSREKTREDQLDTLDERTQWLDLKTKAKTYQIMRCTGFGFAAVAWVCAVWLDRSELITVCVFVILFFYFWSFVQLFLRIYYEKKN